MIWADTRGTLATNRSRLFYSYSYDAGQTWAPNVEVSPSFDSWAGWPNQNKIGDYYTIVSDDTGASVAWAATFNGEQDVYFLRVFPDCNANGTSDVADVRGGKSADCNANDIPDACEPAASCLAAGSVPDGAGVPGPPLRMGKSGGDLLLSWSASCLAGDADYGIYEGTLGAFDSHVPRSCSTGAATTAELAPAASDTYYLVVAQSGSSPAAREGGYGTTSEGIGRPAAAMPCLPQEITGCLVP